MRPRQRPPVNQKETGNGRYPFVKLQKSGGRKMPDSFQLEMIVAAEPLRVFSAWMDSREHAAFTGGGEAVVEPWAGGRFIDRKSTRLNSSHSQISYAVFCLKKKKTKTPIPISARSDIQQ